MTIPRNRENMSPKLARIAELAREDRQRQFFSIAQLSTVEALYQAFENLRKEASAGVDGVTYGEYARNAMGNIQKLHEKLKGGQYVVPEETDRPFIVTVFVYYF